MSTTADTTLEAIDGCLRDNSVSQDAMRWSPDAEADEVSGAGYTRGGMAGFSPSLVIYDEVNWDAVERRLAAFTGSFATGMLDLSLAFSKALLPIAEFGRQVGHNLDARDRPRWHRNRCRECNPAGNPLPLEGGAEYRRRQKARKRRGG